MKPLSLALSAALIAVVLLGCSISSTDKLPTTPTVQLTDAQKYSLAYMWNEEKLAHDVYLALYALWTDDVAVLNNIANMSESTHIATVEALVEAYDINITNLVDYKNTYSEDELRALAPGEFAIPVLQELYDALYTEGGGSAIDALNVGCKVEVRDIADLNDSIATADGIEDLVTAFTSLQADSYKHYTNISKALKGLGVTQGCCALGAEYCITTP